MKKLTIILLLMIIAITGVFASKFSISTYVNPYALQIEVYKDHEDFGYPKSIKSMYGLGGMVKGRYYFAEKFYLATEISANTLFYYDYDNFSNVDFTAKVGFSRALRSYKRVYTFVDLGIGLNIACANKAAKIGYKLNLGLGSGFSINEHWSLEIARDFTWHFVAKTEKIPGVSVWATNTYIGATYKF